MIVDIKALIIRFGGPAALAQRLGCSRTSIYNWPTLGIPSKQWHPLVQIAEADGIEGITFDMLRDCSCSVVRPRVRAMRAGDADQRTPAERQPAEQEA